MTAEPISCPYCNSLVPPASGPRLTCPRCGESFAHRDQVSANGPPTDEFSAARPEPAAGYARTPVAYAPGSPDVGSPYALGRSSPVSNRTIARIVVGVMALTAAAGLTFALLTVHARRSHDYRQGASQPAPAVRQVLPGRLAGLGYLPADANIVAAIHVAEARLTPAGRAFLDHAELGGTALSMAAIEKNIGISRDNIDHVVLGVRLLDKQLPHPVLIVQTRQPYDAQQVLEAVKARPKIDAKRDRTRAADHKDVYPFNLEKPSMAAFLWPAAPNTLVVTIFQDDMAILPNERAAGIEQLPAALQGFIRERLPLGTPAWLAGHADNWDTLGLLPASGLSDENQKVIATVRTFGFWLRLDERVEVRGALQCSDAAGAQLVDKTLTRALAKNNNYLNVLGPDGRQVAEELVKSLQIKQADEWVTVEATAGAETVKKAVGK
jgi:hypothetical protein